MTLILSIPLTNAIIMGADSRKTTEVKPLSDKIISPTELNIEYSEMNKIYKITNIGCITCWGDLTNIQLRLKEFVSTIKPEIKTVQDLAEALYDLLEKNIDKDSNLEVGFHVGGYMNDEPKLYHIFYGRESGESINSEMKFKNHDESGVSALYNGKPKIPHAVIQLLLALEEEVGMVKWLTKHDISMAVSFVEFMIKRATKVESTIGGKIRVVTILPDNSFEEKTLESADTEIRREENNSDYIPPSGISSPIQYCEGTSISQITASLNNESKLTNKKKNNQ